MQGQGIYCNFIIDSTFKNMVFLDGFFLNYSEIEMKMGMEQYSMSLFLNINMTNTVVII
jgi:hypothetical protein